MGLSEFNPLTMKLCISWIKVVSWHIVSGNEGNLTLKRRMFFFFLINPLTPLTVAKTRLIATFLTALFIRARHVNKVSGGTFDHLLIIILVTTFFFLI